ncbi:hypothetical protein D3C87_1254870 [compost metagenome]
MLIACDHAAREHMLVIKNLANIKNRSGRHTGSIATAAKLIAVQLGHGGLQSRHDFLTPGHAHGVAGQFLVSAPLR